MGKYRVTVQDVRFISQVFEADSPEEAYDIGGCTTLDNFDYGTEEWDTWVYSVTDLDTNETTYYDC